jgi:hypothetical protein
MQDNSSCFPIPPRLDPSLFRAIRHQEHPAIGLHRGWCAARAGLPEDGAESPAWIEGHRLWVRVRRLGVAQRPTVWPPI